MRVSALKKIDRFKVTLNNWQERKGRGGWDVEPPSGRRSVVRLRIEYQADLSPPSSGCSLTTNCTRFTIY